MPLYPYEYKRKKVGKKKSAQEPPGKKFEEEPEVLGAAFLLSCSSFVDVAPNEWRLDLFVLSRRKMYVFLSRGEF